MTRVLLLLLVTLGCHHAIEVGPKRTKCSISMAVEDKIANTVQTKLECKAKDQIFSTVRVLGNLSCEKRIQLSALVVKPGAATERTDCLILKKRMTTYMASGTPEGWGCAKIPVGTLLDGICDGDN